MTGFLLDTNVLSEFNRRGEPDRLVKQWLEAADTNSLYTSVLTFGEIRLGVELLPPSKRRTQLEQWLERDSHEWFEGRILPVDEHVANRWGPFAPRRGQKGDLSQSLMPYLRQQPSSTTLPSYHATSPTFRSSAFLWLTHGSPEPVKAIRCCDVAEK
jgi:predicted nucleic acid-binding protein